MTWHLNRRAFLQASVAGAASLVARRHARAFDLNGKLRLAAIGTGRKGQDDVLNVSASPRVEVVALCDVDHSPELFGWAAEKYPKAEQYADFRRLMDKAESFDAVTVSTPDHMHAPIAVAAMQRGKHVFCQKPLTHTVAEARRMREVAQENRVITQMGNQIQSHPSYRTAVKLLQDGVIGKVREVHAWQSSEMDWLPKNGQVTGSDPVPNTLQWDLWLGVAPERVYKTGLYHPHKWRGWQDFGGGQLADFGCHILDPIFMGLGLGAPITIEAEAPPIDDQIWAPRSKVVYEFPGTARTSGDRLSLTWYDGKGHRPKRRALGLPRDYKVPGGGSCLLGDQGTMVIPHYDMPVLFPKDKFAEFKMPDVGEVNHYTSWVDACHGDGQTTSNFGYAGPLTEAVLLGVVAIQFPKEQLQWNAPACEITHNADATARLTKTYREGWPNPVE
jgi:predicted dehydrogenase